MVESASGAQEAVAASGDESAPMSRIVKINILCLVGAVVGFAAIFSPWTWMDGFSRYPNNLDDIISYLYHILAGNWMLPGGVIFCFGVLFSFLTPLGGIAEAIGLALFLVDARVWIGNMDGPSTTAGFGAGFYLGIVSSAIICFSAWKPMGIGYGEGQRRSRDWRFPTFASSISDSTKSSQMREEKKPSILRSFRSSRKWTAGLVVAVVMGAAYVAVANYPYEDPQPLTQIEGGVAWSISSSMFAGGSSLKYVLNDSIDSVSWNWTRVQSDDLTWGSYDLGNRSLGSLNVSLTFIDWDGNGYPSVGDAVTLVAGGAYGFSEDTVYRLSPRPNVSIRWLDIISKPSYGITEISFRFHDGSLESWVSSHVSNTRRYYW
jgi:hypothetical protein